MPIEIEFTKHRHMDQRFVTTNSLWYGIVLWELELRETTASSRVQLHWDWLLLFAAEAWWKINYCYVFFRARSQNAVPRLSLHCWKTFGEPYYRRKNVSRTWMTVSWCATWTTTAWVLTSKKIRRIMNQFTSVN